jgi:hypothetical protein
MKKLFLLFGLLIPALSHAQNYSIDWYKIAGGGGTSSGGNFSISGTIGQHDAGLQQMSGGNYSLTGGFWSLYAIQTPGLPGLAIVFISPNSVKISWPNTGSYTLQMNSNLTPTSWIGYGGSIATANGTNSVTISPSAGNLFFRLHNP